MCRKIITSITCFFLLAFFTISSAHPLSSIEKIADKAQVAYFSYLFNQPKSDNIDKLLTNDVVYIDNLKSQKFVGKKDVLAHINKVVATKLKILKHGKRIFSGTTVTENDLTENISNLKKPLWLERKVTVNNQGKIIKLEVNADDQDKSLVISLPGEKG